MATAPPLLDRYRDLLAADGESFAVTLGEGGTPLLHARRLGAELGLERLFLRSRARTPPAASRTAAWCSP
jgi:threonine synthase